MSRFPLRGMSLSSTLFLSIVAAAGIRPALAAPGAAEAKAAAAEQDWDRAATEWQGVVKAKPSDREAIIGFASAVRDGRLYDFATDADVALRVLTQKNEKDGEAWALRGEIALLRGESPAAGGGAKFLYADAEAHLKLAAEVQPDLEAAATGLARVQFGLGNYQEAIDALNAYLARGTKTQARALFWLGEIHYRLALNAHKDAGQTYPVAGEVKRLFEEARHALEKSAAADGSFAPAWMDLAYTCQYLQDVNGAAKAYEAAARVAPHNDAALRGLASVLTYEPKRYLETLAGIVKDKPRHPMANYYLAQAYLSTNDAADRKKALDSLKIATETLRFPANAWVQIGDVELMGGNRVAAEKAWFKALETDPHNELAAWKLEEPLRETGMVRAKGSLRAAQEVIADYKKLLDRAPRNTLLLNNLAFILREAYGAHAGDASWRPILDACTETYVRASEIIGEFGAEHQNMPLSARLSNAQVVSDTGLMFQFYPQTRDLKRAESYYLIALDWSDNGYWDAFNNLTQIWQEAQRWEEIYDLADAAAESLVDAEGNPSDSMRARARAMADQLVQNGRVDR